MIEAMVSLILLVMVLSLSMSLLFSMRSFAEKTQYNVQPRQTARRAVDYLTYHISGAADLNYAFNQNHYYGQPNAIVTFYTPSDAARTVINQAAFNNFAGTETSGGQTNAVTGTVPDQTTNWGDLDTDLVTLAVIDNAQTTKAAVWPGDRTSAVFFNYRAGCSVSDAVNLQLFQQATGYNAATGRSGLLMLFDEAGAWDYYRIGTYTSSNCANPENVISVTGQAAGYETAPSGTPFLTKPTLATGVSFVSFRVRKPTDALGVPTGPPNLEQKIGLFDPLCDRPSPAVGCPAVGFTPIMEGIENLQIAYLFGDGSFRNGSGTTLGGRGVPSQAGPCASASATCTFGLINGPNPANPTTTLSTDVTNVVGLRVSVIARSPALPIGAKSLSAGTSGFRMQRPALEDSSAGPLATANDDWFERYRLTTNILLRNRNLRY
ncbi:MAG: hypothetical protein JNK60_11010 [Acidobacteria bacterium]|nr:hypothetical protein [Acidobacteriota bacterium]